MKIKTEWFGKIRKAAPIYFAALCAVFLLPLFSAEAYQIKRVVRGSTSMGATVEAMSLDISASLGGVGLDLNKSFLIVTSSLASSDHRQVDIRASIDSPTALMFTRRTSGTLANIEYMVVEFTSGVTVYSGITTIAENALSKVITLPASVNLLRSFPLASWASYARSDTNDECDIFSVEVTAGNQLTIKRSDNGGGAAGYNNDISYQIVEFDRDVKIQHGTTTIAAASASAAVNLNVGGANDYDPVSAPTNFDPIVTAKSYLVISTNPDSAINGDEDMYATKGVVTDANTLTFTRQGTSNTVEIKWYLIEIQNEGFAKGGSAAMAVAATSATPSLAPDSVDMGRSLAFISTQLTGATATTADFDEINLRAQISAANQLTLTRQSSTYAISAGWFAAEFPLLDVTAPNGAEVWKVGETRNITWLHSDTLNSGGTCGGKHCVKIELSTNGGTSYPLSIVTGIDGTLDTYAWTIPATISTTNLIGAQLKVKITDTDYSASTRNFDVSNNNFEIKGTLALTAPAGGETWYISDSRAITWNNTGDLNSIAPGTLTIKLSSNGGTSYDHTIATGVAAGNGAGGSYTWNPIPETMDAVNLIGSNRRVKLILNSDSTVTTESTGNFTLKGKITVTSPNTGLEEWPIGTSQNITWTKNGVMTTVTLLYSTNSGGSYPNTIATGVNAATGTPYAWNPIPATATNFARIKVMSEEDNSVFDASDADFKIIASILVTSPDTGNEVWRVGEPQNITWTIGGTVNNVCLQYSKDGGAYTDIITPVCSTPAAAGSYAWTIPDIISNNVKVKIYNVDAPAIFDESNNAFKIKGKLVVITPNNGEVYTVSSSQVIQWTASGTMGNVRVKFAQNGVDFSSILTPEPTGVPAADQNFTWNPVPDAITSTGKVRVELISDAAGVFDDSNASFAIKGTLTLGYPNGGETLSVGAPCTLTWTKNGTLGNVELRYSTDGGLTFPDTQIIATGIPAGDLSVAWPGGVPDAIDSDIRAKIFLISDQTVYDTSNANFAIKGSLTLTSPNLGTERWEVGTFQNITWTRNGSSMTTVRLDYSKNGGVDGYAYPIAAGVASSDLSKSWQIPDAIGSQVKVKIALESDSTTNDASDANFSIIGRFAMIAPVGGETWYVGTQQNIDWTNYGTIDKVNLYYSTNGGATYGATIATGEINLSVYPWTIPDAIGNQVKVKIENFNDNSVFVVSPSSFTVKGRVVVTSPNGGEVWRVGEAKNITWTSYGSIGNVDIYYSTDGGTTYPPGNQITPGGGVAASLGTYPWTVPDAVGANLKIKVVAVSDNTVVDESNAVFEIKGTLTLTAPDGNQTFSVGDSTNITWTKTGTLGNVELRYSTDAGATYPVGNTIVTGIAATATPQAWTVPDAIGNQVRVKVILLSDPNNVSDESNNNITIKGGLTLTSPNLGTETWEVGTSQNITWTRNGSISTVKLEYSTDGGNTYPSTIIASTSAAALSYSWTIPDAIGTTLKVKITDTSDATVNDASDANFTIKGKLLLTYPNGAETFIVGTSYNIAWNSYGTISKVNLYYSTNSGASYGSTITTALTNTNSYSWSVPDIIGTQVRVKVENFDNSAVADTSNADFTVKGSIALTYPNGGETFIVGESKTITWTKSGALGNVDLYYSTDGGATYPPGNKMTGAGGVPSGDLSFAWTVPDSIGNNVKLKIVSITYPNVLDESNAVLTIKGSVTVTAPNGGEVMAIGAPNFDITWTKTGSIGNVKLEYSSDGGATYPYTIAPSVDSALLTYSWPIPDNPTTQAKVKITGLADSSVTDASDLNFRIRGSLNLTAPNGSENWVVGSQQSIAWTMTGALANAKLEYSTNSGSTYLNVITASTSAAAGSYTWTIPDDVSCQVRVRITDVNDSTVTDASAADFCVKPSVTLGGPNGGEVFAVNSVQNITWSMVGTIANVKLEYSTDGGSTYPNTIISSTPAASLSYAWTVPDTISNTCMVKVSSAADASVNDVSNAYFKIRGSLTLTAPNGAESWPINSNQYITWTKVGSIASVKLEYSTNAFTDELQTYLINASVNASSGTPYTWTIPDKPGTNTKVRVTDTSDSTVFDVSNAVFSIKGTLTVTAPNGGETWVVGAAQNITWTKFGAIANVELRYSIDSGATYPGGNVIIASTPADNLSYSWTIPDSIGNQLRVKITDVGDGTVFDESGADFAIKGSVAVTAPNGGETWYVGGNQNITWTRTGSFANVKLEYSTNAFANELQTTVITNSTPAGALTYAWTVPDAIGTNLKVRISDSSNANVTDVSNAAFTVKGVLALTSPNGGETWVVNESRNITWNRTGAIANVKLEYSTDAGSTYPNTIIASTPAAVGTYAWTVSDSIGNQLKVRVSDASDATVNDVSNANFTVKGSLTITSPNGAEAWTVGSSRNITWTRTGTVANVKLEYSTNGFSDELQTVVISNSYDASLLTYPWTVPDAISSNVKVRATNTADASVSDVSDTVFKIIGSLALTAPNGGEKWTVGTSQNITWTRVGSIANAKLEYSTNGGTTYPNLIIASTSAAPLSYNWTVPDAISAALRVKISDATDATVFDESNANFEILAGFTITAPNGGEVWTVGASQSLTWTTAGTAANVKLEYSTNAFADELQTVVIIASTLNLNTYSWNVPDTISATVKIRVSDAGNANANDVSSASFKIRGNLTLTAPNGGETWMVEATQNITWTKIGSIVNVKLEYSTDGGATYPNLIAASTSAALLSYAWTVPDAIGTQVRVKVADASDATVYDESNANFTIKGSLTITAPNGGQQWVVGTSQNITWTKTGTMATVKLEYSTNAFANELQTVSIATLLNSTTGTPYAWTIPDAISSAVKVRVTNEADATVSDISDASFKIIGSLTLASPNGAEGWNVGSAQNIVWTKVGSIANVKLEYSTDGGASYPNLIALSVNATSGTPYAWTVPDAIGTQVRVKVADASDATVYDESNANFTIKAGFALTAPNGGEVWVVGTGYDITWTNTGTVASVKLEYSTDSGATYPNVIAASVLNTNSYLWTVPDSVSNTVRVRVSDVLNTNASDASDANFKIRAGLTLASPNGAESFLTGISQNITWTKTGTMATVKLEYSTNSGATYPNVIATLVNAATGTPYAWTIPDNLSTTCRVKITNEADSLVFDASNADFTIKGSLTLTAPNGGETWVVGATQNITWTRTGSIASVKLEYSTNSGTTYPNTIIASTSGLSGTYSWTIPDSIGSQLRVKITDTGDGTVFDESGADFAIKGSVTVSAPNGGETWYVGGNQNITWTRTGSFANVKLEYSTNGFFDELQTTVITASTLASALTYAWTVPDAIGTNLKVRISDSSNANVTDVSNTAFTVKGVLALTSPNGGETWVVGESRNITWSRTGSIANVKLEYSTDAGSTYPNTIIASTPAAVGTYAWTVSDSIGNQLKVRVSDASDATVNDVSNANFTVKGSLTITSPNGAEAWTVGSSRNITWTRTGTVANVKLEYSTNGFSDELQTVVISNSYDASLLTYPWTVPDAISSNVKVRATNTADASVSDVSDTVFKIIGSLALTAPNGGEGWVVNTSREVTWAMVGTIANVRLAYSTNGGTSYDNLIIASTPAGVLSYFWTIPDTISTNVKVKISDATDINVFDVSNNVFKIQAAFTITAPNGGEVWTVGTSQDITWNRVGSAASVKLEYSVDGGSTYPNTIIASTSNTGIYSWTIPDSISASVRVRVSDVNDATAVDTSDVNFKIRGSLVLVSPNGNENWTVGSSRNITWTRTGSIATAKLEYSTDAGATYPNLVAASIDASLGTYGWTVPDNISSQVRVRIADTSDGTVSDTSNSNFSIKGTLVLTAPNGGEGWVVGTGENITWTRNGSIVNVKLEYSTDSGTSYPNTIIASTPAAAGLYTWTIPDNIATTIRVRVSDALDSTVNDTTDADFAVRGSLTLTSPNGGEIWTVGETRNITWTRVGSIASVKLEYSTDSGATYPNLIIGVTGAAAGSYSWTVPDSISSSLRVKVTDTGNAAVYDVSNANFTIKGSLTLTSPNGAESWVVGTSQNITWNRTGSIANVKLEYSTDGGATYPNTIIASTSAVTGIYAWSVADAIGTQLRVRVSDTTDATVADASDANFTIKGSLVITSPNGGEAWGVGSSRNITWTKSGTIANVKLEYSTDGGSTYPNLIIASTDAATGSYGWTIPDAINPTVRVKVTSTADASVSDASDLNFKIVGILTLVTPNGGQGWGVNTSQNITWTMSGSISNIRLDYSTNSGVAYPNTIIASTPAGALAYLWTIPDAVSNQVRVKISDAADTSVYDTSDADFGIQTRFDITSPDGGEVWVVESTHDITWTKIGSVPNAKLEYSTDSGVTYPYLISASTINSGSFSWTLPDTISSSVKVKISDVNNANAYDVSAANFKIRGGITVTSPNGAEAWIIAVAYNVTWTKVGSIANVKLEYSTDSGVTYPNLVAASVNASLGIYSWTIPDTPALTCRVKATDALDSSVYDESNADFRIRGIVTVTSPNGAEAWEVGTVQNIIWTRNGSIAAIKLEYSTDGGSTYPSTIVASTDASTLTYPWTVPDSIGNLVRVKATSTVDATVTDASDANFKIKGVVRLTSPNGGEIWGVTSSQNVTWTVTGSVANVKLEYSTDGGATYPNTIIASTTAATGTYAWTIPDNLSSQAKVKVSNVTDSTVADESDATFRIVGQLVLTAPNGGEVWPVASVQSVTWTKVGSITNVKLEFSTDGGVSYPNLITASTPAAALSYAWTIPDAISSTLKVKVTDVNDSTVYDVSDANFKIRGSLVLNAPNGAEVWLINDNKSITWTKNGSIANVRLDYSTDSGATYPYSIVASISAALQTYNWLVPDSASVQVRVKIADAGDATVYDTSDGNFIIRGGFTVTAPNGGERWAVGSTQNIGWSTFGTIPNVRLAYSINNGGNWNVITNSVANTGTYSWTVPDAISDQSLVRIYDVNDASAMDTSDVVFKIHGSLSLTAPNGGEQWGVGSAQSIIWTKVGSIINVKLEYSTDGGATYPNLIVNATPASDLSYGWTVPDAISTSVKMRASDTADATVYDISDGVFKIKGAFLLSAPNGGEAWVVAVAQNIVWTTYGTVANVKLEYSTDAGVSWNLVTSSAANTGTYSWTVPDAISLTCRVRVSDVNDSSAQDTSDNNFKIHGDFVITAPNGGEKWNVGSSRVITWNRTGSVANVKLEYSDNGGATFVPITNSTPNTGSYSWTIPDAITTQARVRVTNIDDTTVTDTSDANFKIQGTLTMSSPNGGEAWVVGSVHDINWTTSGTINFVKLEYSDDGGATYPYLITSSLANVGTTSWTVPDKVSGTVRVKVSDASDSEAFDVSNGNFRIRTTIILTSPNGGELRKVGSSYNITWTNVGTIATVKIEYSRFNFLTDINEIAAAAANTGIYSWTVPDTISNTVRARVTDPNDAGAYDGSDADFRIVTGLTMTSPNGSEMWDVNSAQSIAWTCTSAQANVPQIKLEYSVDGGATFPNIIAATNNTGSYAWTVPDTISAQFKMRVSDLADSTAYDISDNNAKIRAKFTVTSPNGGEVWTVGESRNVTWTSVGTVANVKLDYSLDDFLTSGTIVAATPNNGSYAWTIPDALAGAGTSVATAKVRVMSTTDTDAFDVSDAAFKIRGAFAVTAPNGGELWLINQNNALTWTTTGTIANVRLVYSTDSGVTYPNTIVASAANLNTYNWLIPDAPTPNARVRVIDAADNTVYDDSNVDFRIRGFYTLLSPNGGEEWLLGSAQNITWNKGGTIGYKISYSTDSGATYPNVIVTNTNPAENTGAYSWAVPGTVADGDRKKMRVKIEDPNDDTVYDASDADFTIKGVLTVTAPNGAERWVTNESRAIAWSTPSGPIANVKLEYSTNGGATYSTIVASTANTGLYNWTVPDNRSTTVRVRVSDVANAAVSDASDADFEIDYYTMTWELRDLLTNELLTNLSVAEVVYGTTTYNWQAAGLTAPLTHDTPYGYWTTTWTVSGYGDKAQNFTADSDKTFVLFMETTAIHIWRAYTNFAYTATADTLAVTAWLERDGFVVTGAVDVTVDIYDGGVLIKTLSSNTPNSAGFFDMTWNAPTNLIEGVVYGVVATITNASGALFKTPNSFQITEAKRLQATETAMKEMRDVTLPNFQTSLTGTVTTKLDDQMTLITNKMTEQKDIITSKTNEMTSSVQQSLTSFETKSGAAVTQLQAGADQAVEAGGELEATAKRYSWNAMVSPDPALTGDLLTFNCQGTPNLSPMISIYSNDGDVIVSDQVMLQTREGLYVYEIVASREKFAPGQAYTFIVAEQITGGLVSGSGMVESSSITTIAGLAAAAPEAERTAKKVLEAVQTLQNVLVSDNPINIGLALTELQKTVDDLPTAIAKESGLAPTARTLNEISDKLAAIVGKKEGIDIAGMLEDALSDSPTIKEIRSKTDAVQGVIKLLMQLFEAKFGGSDAPVVSTSLSPGSVKFRIAAANPSKTKPQKVPVKVYLPQEVKPKDVMDLGGLNLEFDQEKSIYYVYSNDIELNPLETRLFEVEVEDIWFVPKEDTDSLKKQTEAIVNNLKDTAYQETAVSMGQSIYERLDNIVKSQSDDTISREQHIGLYRNNLQVIVKIKEDIARLEKLLVAVGGLPEPSMLKKVKIKGDAPTRKVTWIVIFVIIIFIGLLAGVFFFTWSAQLRSSESLLKEAKKEAFGASRPFDFTKGKGGEKK